ncbi:MAG: protein-ADP-ribose hydrolase [Anaerotignaceae bacterium]
MTKSEKLDYLIKNLNSNIDIPKSENEKWVLFRSLVNIRNATPISNDFLEIQDSLLKEVSLEKGITNIEDLKPIKNNMYLWQGDITTLKVDAIVNAANSGMTGCYHPCHGCIDNAIHTFAGVQLRLECNDVMEKQGFAEPTGKAKITDSYNLPCKKIIHTVGPIISRKLTTNDCLLLKNCYLSCLEIAKKNNLKSIAFCCISTGEFHFPNDKAAEIAVATVEQYLKENNSQMRVIFNVFKDLDYSIYNSLLI